MSWSSTWFVVSNIWTERKYITYIVGRTSSKKRAVLQRLSVSSQEVTQWRMYTFVCERSYYMQKTNWHLSSKVTSFIKFLFHFHYPPYLVWEERRSEFLNRIRSEASLMVGSIICNTRHAFWRVRGNVPLTTSLLGFYMHKNLNLIFMKHNDFWVKF